MFLLKLIWNSSSDALYWWIVHYFFLSTWTQWTTVIKWLSHLWWNLMHAILWYLYVYVNPFPNDYVYRFNCLYNFWVLILYLALLNLYFERSLSRKESQFLSEVVFVVTFGIYLYNLGTFWVSTPFMSFMFPIFYFSLSIPHGLCYVSIFYDTLKYFVGYLLYINWKWLLMNFEFFLQG